MGRDAPAVRRPLGVAALAAAIWIAAANSVLAFQLGVAPMRYEIELGPKPVTRTLKIINQGADEMDIAIRVANFTLDRSNKLKEIASTAQSLDQWIIIRPLRFKLKPGATRNVRFAVRPLKRPTPGERRAVIFIERAGVKNKQKGKMNIGFRFGVVIYAHAGKRVRRARLVGIDAERDGLKLDIKSTGNAHARIIGSYGIWPAKAFPGQTVAAALIARSEFIKSRDHRPRGTVASSLLPDAPILPGARRTIEARYPSALQPGTYRMLVRGRIGETSIERLLTFSVGG